MDRWEDMIPSVIEKDAIPEDKKAEYEKLAQEYLEKMKREEDHKEQKR